MFVIPKYQALIMYNSRMNLDELRKKKTQCLSWKNIIPWQEQMLKAKEINIDNINVELGDWIKIGEASNLSENERQIILDTCKILIPWRKGPFDLFDIKMDSEWQSFIKYNLIKPHFDLKDKIVADIGCNNGFYMFKMLEDKPKKIVGFDPAPLPMMQFDFINHFIKSDIVFEMLGVEHLEYYEHKFDFIFMLGVLYHRPDPVGTLKSLARALNKNGEVIIDTFMIDGDEEIALTPNGRYSKIPNIYFVPTVKALHNWLNRAGFVDIEVLEITTTSSEEQRKTDWSFDQSLEDFLDPDDKTKTIEGYPAPKRVYMKARKKN